VTQFGFRSIVSAPLLLEGEPIGNLTLRRMVPEPFTDGQIRQLQTFADQAVVAIQNARLFKEIEEKSRQLAEASQHKSQFLANMSHELRTPLNAIQGYAQLLELGIHGPVSPEQLAALGRIDRAQRHLLGLVNDVLDYASLGAGRVEYDVRPVLVADGVADVLPMVEPQLAAKGLAVDVRVPEVGPDDPAGPSPVPVWADREKLGQVFLNLLSNAIKFTPSGGRITVDVVTRDDGTAPTELVYLRVADTGIGVPREKLEAIFEPFVQVRSDYARAAEGTGLGLAISRDLARGVGGDLRVRSVEGEGAVFTVALRRVTRGDGALVDRRTEAERRSDLERRSAEDRRHHAS
jgi:signal transduction histidine kinase